MKQTLLFLIIILSSYKSIAQDFVSVYTSKFGKITLHSDENKNLLSGDFKVATSYDGRFSEINLIDGKLHGERKDFNKEGTLIKVSNYKEGLLNGKNTSYFKNGTIKKEEFYNASIPMGEWKTFDSNGKNTSIESYKNGLKEGKWVSYKKVFNSDKIATTTKFYKAGKASGTWKSIDSDNLPIWTKKHITSTQYERQEFYPNGKIRKKTNHKKGKPYGTFEEYYDTGILKTKSIYENNRVSYKLQNHENGKTKSIVNSKDGKRHGKHEQYAKTGKLTRRVNYINGKINGTHIQVNSDSKKHVTSYKMGDRHGSYKVFYPNGNTHSLCAWSDNQRDGLWKFYNKDKKLIKEIKYDKGAKISEVRHK